MGGNESKIPPTALNTTFNMDTPQINGNANRQDNGPTSANNDKTHKLYQVIYLKILY